MSVRYRFSDPDRERLGITDEWVELDMARLMFDEADGLDQAGYDVDEFLEDFSGHPVYKDGEPVMVDVVDDDGNQVLEDGKPKQVQRRRVPMKAIGAAMWIAARRGGSTAPFDGFTYDMVGLQSEVEPEGKDDSPAPASGS